MNLINNFRYRPEIDGLRAIAVLAVVLFHARLGVPGGFIGVDVFFVISGYLITSLIIKDLEAGKFTFSSFWERRARRILPAAFVLVLAVLIAGWFLLLPTDYAALGESAAMHSVFVANVYFWKTTNYFAASADTQPLLHTWSLAVEEQFYFIVPLVLFGLFIFPAFRRRGVLLFIFLIGFLLSLALSVFLLTRMQTATFYLLPTRAWELLCGSIIAILPPLAATTPRAAREALCLVGISVVLVPCFLYTKETSFPGLAALPPCLGAALFIWAAGQGSRVRSQTSNHSSLTSSPTPDQYNGATSKLTPSVRLLSTRPLVFIGLVSYSLYLWHWPLFAFSTYWSLGPMSLGYRIFIVAASFVLALLSWRFVETPFRSRNFIPSRSIVFGGSIVALSCILVASFLISKSKGMESRFTTEARRIAASSNDFSYIRNMTTSDVPDRLTHVGIEGLPPRLFVWGDSYAMALLPAIDAVCREKNWAGRAATRSATAPVLDWCKKTKYGREAPEFNTAVFETIKNFRREGLEQVILVGYWELYLDKNEAKNTEFSAALNNTILSLSGLGLDVILIQEVPQFPFDPPRALALSGHRKTTASSYVTNLSDHRARTANQARIFSGLPKGSVRFVDPAISLADSNGVIHPANSQGVFYRDSHHLSTYGSLQLIPLFRTALNP